MIKPKRSHICFWILLAFSVVEVNVATAAYSSGSGSSGGSSSSSTLQQYSGQAKQSNVPLNQPATTQSTGAAGGTGATKPIDKLKPIITPPSPQSISVLYTMPGIATLQGGQWVGNADLYNLTSGIGLVTEIISPSGNPVSLAEQMIIDKIVPVLKEAGINAKTVMTGDSPLPFLHFLFMIYPIEKGYVAYCAARLFESAKISRVYLKTGITWQVITWEKQELLVFPANELVPQIDSIVSLILKDFVTQYKVKPEQKQQ